VTATAGDRTQYARIGHCLGVALALQVEFLLVDAARYVGGEHQQQIDGFGPGAGRAGNGADQAGQGRGNDGSRSHATHLSRFPRSICARRPRAKRRAKTPGAYMQRGCL
jgi:hypothetical protein